MLTGGPPAACSEKSTYGQAGQTGGYNNSNRIDGAAKTPHKEEKR